MGPFTVLYYAVRDAAWAEANCKTEKLQAATDPEALWREYVERQAAHERAEARRAQMYRTIVEIEDPVACADILVRDYPDVSKWTLKQAAESVEFQLKREGLGDLLTLHFELLRRHPAFRQEAAA